MGRRESVLVEAFPRCGLLPVEALSVPRGFALLLDDWLPVLVGLHLDVILHEVLLALRTLAAPRFRRDVACDLGGTSILGSARRRHRRDFPRDVVAAIAGG